MDLQPFLLDHWLAAYEFRDPPIRYNLASSTGPRWTIDELQLLPEGKLDLFDMPISYAPPDGSKALRAMIAGHHCVDPDWVVVTSGASEALSILFCLGSEPGSNVALPTPAFPAFAAMARAWNLGVNEYLLERQSGYRQSVASVVGATDAATALAVVNTPHNPTGALFERSALAQLAAHLAERGIPLVVDEVYHPLYFEEHASSASGLKNVIVVGDMSKAFSLPGLRVGWIIDANPERRKRIIDARSYFTVSSSPLSESLAIHALRNRETVLARLAVVATANLRSLTDFIENVEEIAWVRPSGGTTAYPWFVDGRDTRPFCTALADAGVLIVPGDCFAAPEHMRIGLGAQSEGFDEAIAIMRDVLTGALA
jgi:aspartate/methionine/tyrosine aminotransferase